MVSQNLVTALDSQPDPEGLNITFANTFGNFAGNLAELEELKRAQATILRPLLEKQFLNVECSQLSRHMWSHCKDLDFANKAELYTWVREHWEVKILSKTSMVSAMKTAGTKNCQLCTLKCVKLSHAFHDKKAPTNLMNSRTELYGKCSCQT